MNFQSEKDAKNAYHIIPSIFCGLQMAGVLAAAIRLELFTLLDKTPLTGEEIKRDLELHGRNIYDFLDVFVAIGLLQREGEGIQAIYSNSSEAKELLVKHSPYYVGRSYLHSLDLEYNTFNNLIPALRTGKPHRPDIVTTGEDLFELTYKDDHQRDMFTGAMIILQKGAFTSFATKFDFSRYSTICDIGGNNGFFSVKLAQNIPHLNFITCDLPAIHEITAKKIKAQGLSDRIKVADCDFFKDEFPNADIIHMGNILHDWDEDIKKMLIAKAYRALNQGGAFVAIERIIDDERRTNFAGMLISISMLLVTEGGYDFTFKEFECLAKEVGFCRCEKLPLTDMASAVIAYKE